MKTFIKFLSVIAVLFTSVYAQAEEYKVSKIKHIENFSRPDDSGTYITELIYDDDGRLIRFLEYNEKRPNNPRFDVNLVWEKDQVTFSGPIDWDYEHGVINLGENGLATDFVSYEGYSSTFKYENNTLSQLHNIYGSDWDDFEIIDLAYQNEELTEINKSSGRSILLKYDNSPQPCNIPSLFINHNCLFYYRFIAYAGLLGHPLKYCPSSFNRYNNGWMPIEYTFDENGNITKIYSPNGGLTSSMVNETFTFEYTKTNSLESINEDKIQMYQDNKTLKFTGKSSNDMIEAFDNLGRLVKSSTENSITIDVPGMYIIKVGSQTFKTIM